MVGLWGLVFGAGCGVGSGLGVGCVLGFRGCGWCGGGEEFLGGGGDGVAGAVSFVGDAVGDDALDSVDGVVGVLGDGVVVFGGDVVCRVVEVVVFGGGDAHFWASLCLVGVVVPGDPGWGAGLWVLVCYSAGVAIMFMRPASMGRWV